MKKKDFKSLLYDDIIRRNRISPFLIFVSFLFSFAFARLIVMNFPEVNLFISQYHIHHFYYGVGLLFVANWIVLVSEGRSFDNLAAILTGVGLGLVVDEVGLLLTCSSPDLICDYWTRLTYDVVIWFAGLFFAVLYAGPILRFFKSSIWSIKKIFSLNKKSQDKE